MSREDEHFRLRIPGDIKKWVRARSVNNMRSMTAEIIFILREKMSAATGEGLANTAPAAASSNNAALAGGASITNG